MLCANLNFIKKDGHAGFILRIIKEIVNKCSFVTAIFKTTAKKIRFVLKMLLVKQNSNIAGQNVLRVISLSK